MMSVHPGLNRTATSSTASTMWSESSPAATSFTSIPPSSRNSPKMLTPPPSGHSAKFPRKREGSPPATGAPDVEQLDKWGYLYSLRIAALQQRLSAAAPPAPITPMSPTSPMSPRFPTSPRPNPSRFSVSSAGSRMTMTGDVPPPEDTDQTIKRKKSSLRISIGGSKGELKFPKEFLMEFWERLSAEEGDSGWTQAVRGFMLLVQKKGTKTANANMREIPALLQTFATCLPPPGPSSALAKEHRAHLIRLLYHFLPVSSYFVSSKSEKDKNLLFRLRAELQCEMHKSPTDPESDFSPMLMVSGMAAKAAAGNRGSHTPLSPSSPLSPRPPANRPSSVPVHNVHRKPSPQWEGATTAPTEDLIDVVGLIWGVSRYSLDGDLQAMTRSGPLEKLYLRDLKARLSALARSNDPSAKERQSSLSGALASLVAKFPDLIHPGSPETVFATEGPCEPFFTPPRKWAVFNHLVRRAAEAGNTIRAAELLEHCQTFWEMESKAEKERQVDALFRQWERSLGSPDEAEWAHRLGTVVADLNMTVSPSEPLSPVLEHIRTELLAELSHSVQSIFPTTNLPPPAPSPSVFVILKSAPAIFLTSPESVSALSDLADELRGAAVGEYVMAASEMGIHQYQVGSRTGESGKDAVVEGFEKLAIWIESEVSNIRKTWGSGLGAPLDPAAIVIHKQLPLFLAEISVLETATGSSSDVFILYEMTSRLLALWDRLCPGFEHGFDLDNFFEPHVVTWLRETEVNETYQWVARTIGMDQWIPEGDGRFSQSVTDLFEFIRSSTQLVRDLPLSEYKRAVFLIDMSKTASIAVTEYAKSVHMLFQTDMTPLKATPAKETPMPSLSMGKAGAWLAKGRHAVQKVEQKLVQTKADGFLVPSAALVKLTNMGAANMSLEDVGYFMEADECARVVRDHGLTQALDKPHSHRFSVEVLRGQNLLTKSGKPADGLVTITDKVTGERLFKSRTVLESEDPKWEQTFEVVVNSAKTLELEALDRQLVGKHDLIGSRSFKLDPDMFTDMPVRDMVLPLSPRGVVHLRVSLDASLVNDVSYHLTSASRVLENTAADMVLEIVDRMAGFISAQLSRNTLNIITKPLRDRKRGRIALTECEIDNSLAPLFDYLDANFALFNSTLINDTRLLVMLSIWRRTVDILISLLIPPLSEHPATCAPLSPVEVDIVFKWLQQLRAFFNAAENGVEHGVPSAQLSAGSYKDMLLIGQYLDLPTPALRERAAAAVRAASSVTCVDGMRSLSISGNGSRARVEQDNERMAEVMLRILRMRPDTHDFLTAQLGSLLKSKVDRQGAFLC